MKESHIIASIYSYINSTYDPPPAWCDPQKFDPRADDLSSFYELYAEVINEERRRKAGPQRMECRIVAHCHARTSGNIYGSLKEAEGIAGALRHKEIPIYDYDESDTPQIGLLRMGEVQINRTTEEKSEWQSHLVVIEGTAQAYQ